MIIGIELRHVVLGASGGIAQLLKGVLEHAIRRESNDRFVLFCTVFNRDLFEVVEGTRLTVRSLPLDRYYADVDRLCRDLGVDVLFRGYPAEDTLTFPLARQVFHIPDIQHEFFPQFFSDHVLRARRAAFTRAQVGAGAIGTLSEFSRRTIVDSPLTKCADVFLMPPALQREHTESPTRSTGRVDRAPLPVNPYFLFPANVWPHKNHRGLIAGFRRFLDTHQGEQFELVLTGHPDGWRSLRSECTDLPVTHRGFVDAPTMRLLFERAVALTFFSLFEGFGMPLLEAFDAGTPVLCSNTTSLPEVGGDAVLTCDPEDPDAIAGVMHRIVSEPQLRQSLVERGRYRLAAYDWETSATNFIAACHRVHARNHRRGDLSTQVTEIEPSAPLVSIVTPSFNQAVYLRRTIDSVLHQSYRHIELIVVDGMSTDDSVSILREYGDRIQWTSEPDNGQTHAINKGMRLARGEILAYLNSDDVLLPDAVARVVRHFADHPQSLMVYGKAFYIDEHDQRTGEYPTRPYSPQRLAEECIICQPATFWRRSLRTLVGEFDERLNYVMDYDYWLRAANAGARIDFVDEHLASSRRYPETKTLSARGKIYREIFDVCWRHNRFIGLDYFIGYWHHLLRERMPRLGAIAGAIGVDYVPLGHAHFRWTHWKGDTLARARAAVVGGVTRVRRSMKRLAERTDSMSDDDTRVTGFATDNWIETRLSVSHPRRSTGGVGYLQGVSPTAQTVDIVVDGVVVERRQLEAQRVARLELPPSEVVVSSIEFVFSAARHARNERGHAFLVEATNLFSEEDTRG